MSGVLTKTNILSGRLPILCEVPAYSCVDRTHRALRITLAWLAAFYGVTLGALVLAGVTPTIPITIIPFCLVFVIPLA
jgi:hypothetical protein